MMLPLRPPCSRLSRFQLKMQFTIFRYSLLMILVVSIATEAQRSEPAAEGLQLSRRGNFTNEPSHESTSSSVLEAIYGPIGGADMREQDAGSHQRHVSTHHGMGFPPPGYSVSQAVALGAESQPPNTSAALPDDPNGPPQVLIADGNTIMPADMMLQQQQPILPQDPATQMAMMSNSYAMSPQGASPAKQQVLASLYIDQFGNQQLGIPRLQQQQPDQMPPDIRFQPSPSRLSASNQAQNFYGPQSAEQIGLHRAHSSGRAGKMEKLRLRDKMKFPSEKKSSESGAAAKLTNKQLMSLIDELKEFNSKQASNLRAKGASTNKEQDEQTGDEDASPDPDNDIDPSNVETKHAAKSGDRRSGEAGRDEKIGADDLAKFAKFLMTKEGANMRFQLGLEKDAPDDGDHDEDDRDPLLESKSRSRKSGAKPENKIDSAKELNELDSRHNEVSEQMDKLLEDLTGTLDEAARRKKIKKKKKKRPASFDIDTDNESSRFSKRHIDARGPRQAPAERLSPGGIKSHVVSEIVNRSDDQGRAVVVPLREKGHDDNFARQLIEQELQQDELESKLRAEHRNEPPERGGGLVDGAKAGAKGETRRRGRQVESIQIKGGNEEEKYHKPERHRDRLALMRELNKSRASKSKMRSASSLPHEPVVRQALAGGIGLQAESQPDGNLLLRTARGHSMRLRLPKRGDKSTRVSHTSSTDEEGARPSQDQRESAASEEDGSKLKRVELESEQPLKDEYPISKRVSSGLDALSNNLDRYFNDSFMGEIESKSRVARGGKSKPKESGESQEASSSNINKSAADAKDKGAAEGDQDFDVNVGIDGKREPVDKDEEYDYESGEEAAEKKEPRRKESRASKKAGPVKDRSRAREKGPAVEKRSRKLAKEPTANSVQGLSSTDGKADGDKLDDELAGRTMKQNLSAADEHMTFESHDGPIPGKLDPVEGESFDSPIGPDGDSLELQVPASADKRVESSHESKNVLTRHGKRVFAPKFYEEPDWR